MMIDAHNSNFVSLLRASDEYLRRQVSDEHDTSFNNPSKSSSSSSLLCALLLKRNSKGTNETLMLLPRVELFTAHAARRYVLSTSLSTSFLFLTMCLLLIPVVHCCYDTTRFFFNVCSSNCVCVCVCVMFCLQIDCKEAKHTTRREKRGGAQENYCYFSHVDLCAKRRRAVYYLFLCVCAIYLRADQQIRAVFDKKKKETRRIRLLLFLLKPKQNSHNNNNNKWHEAT